MSAGAAIGIDLGTAFSCVGVFQDGRVEIIANGLGDRKTPSVVAFTDKEYLTGVAAMKQAAMNPTNTVYDAKRLIGRRFNDEAVQSDMLHWPFKVINSEGKPKVEVKHCDKTKRLTAEEISSMILLEMKKTAEAYTGKKVTDAVITVPAYFNINQRQATINAGKIAGLNVMRIVSEPMAAALAYGSGKRVEKQRNVLIFDLGGGTLDVSVMSIGNEKFEVIAVGGDTHLGGGDFDSRLMDHCVNLFKQEHGGIDLTTNAKAISRLRKALNQMLSDAKLDKADVDEVLLVGGSTRILKVQQLLQDIFSGSKFDRSINPDEAAACGAALLASSAIDEQSLVMQEVAPFSVNLVKSGGSMKTLIERNLKIPSKKTMVCTTSADNQQKMLFWMNEGEQLVTNENDLVGEFIMLSIPSLPRRSPQIKVTFAIDENGIFNVSAVDVLSEQQMNVYVWYTGRLSEGQIEQMLNDAEELKLGNEKRRGKMVARNELESYIVTMQSMLEDDGIGRKTSKEQRNRALTMCETVFKEIDLNQEATEEDYELMHKRVENECSPILAAKQHSSTK
ncbi:unnamed protein product [Taenia asiatica]|uniref:Heat shock protein 70 n=1 Tax=Taenia asiatica TaxID=60517 RepID=A0A0R3WF78_TAEAS|nr:unnamed protein product [Taenia asiatica]